MLALSGKRRADPYRDATHATIGYWTDNGGYYHYSTGNGTQQAANGSYVYARSYEQVLPEVKASHDAAGVPFGHWQFDSWFYPKDGNVTGGGGGGGVTNWTADPAIFPSGMAAINKALGGMPMVMHNRQWSPVSDSNPDPDPDPTPTPTQTQTQTQTQAQTQTLRLTLTRTSAG